MPISCAEEVYHYIGGTFESAFDDPDLGPKLARSELRMRLGFVDPDCVMDIDAARHEVRRGQRDDADPSAIVAMDADTANRCCQGLLDLTSAMERGDIAAKGKIDGLLDLVAFDSAFARLYVEKLRNEGRADLIMA